MLYVNGFIEGGDLCEVKTFGRLREGQGSENEGMG